MQSHNTSQRETSCLKKFVIYYERLSGNDDFTASLGHEKV